MNNKILYSYIVIVFSTLLFSFFFEIDISSGGASKDLKYHWNYILGLNENLKVLLEYNHNYKYKYPQHFPLHHILISRLDYLSTDLNTYLNFYFVFSLFLPVLFYYCLDNRFPEIEFKKKIFISLIIYLLPNYQAAAIWGNSHISSLVFFLGSIYFLINLEKKKEVKINLNILFIVFLMACAAYIKQYYVIFFPYLFISIFKITKFRNSIFFCFISLIFSIPGLLIFYNNPMLLGGLLYKVVDFKSSILIVISIIFVYLVPFFISNLKFNFIKIIEIFKKKNSLLFLSLLLIIFFYIVLNFNYIGYLGGGFFHKISTVLIGNNFLFFSIAFLSLLLCFYYFKGRLEDIILIIIISTSFSTGYPVFQKYFEPMMIMLIFLLIKKDFVKKIFDFNYHVVFCYFSFYWIIYFFYSTNIIKKINLLFPSFIKIF